MKKSQTVLLLFLLNLGALLQAQTSDFELQQIKTPFAPGERLLHFQVDDILQAQYYVFYSNDKEDLADANLTIDSSMPHGKVIKYEGSRSRDSKCEFVFPGASTPHAPNIRYFLQLSDARKAQLKGSDYLTRNDRRKIPQLYQARNEQYDTDKNERVFRKECMFFRVLQVETYRNTTQLSAIQEFYMPDDFTIGFAGDSFAAGTGADEDRTNPCYRSKNSGQMRAVRKFITSYPDVSVSYKHVACSGAKITHLTTAIQQEDGENINEHTQFNMLDTWLNNNDHDNLSMLIMNIGGNDIDFADLVKNYYVLPGNFVGSEDQETMGQRFAILSSRYDNFGADINNRFPFTKIAITTLPNITRNSQDEICFDRVTDLREYNCAYAFAPTQYSNVYNPPGEFLAVQNDILLPLNRIIRAKANEHNWGLIDVEDNANANGLCVCEGSGGYFWKFTNAVVHDRNLTAHPNSQGYRQIYTKDITNHLATTYFEELVPYYGLTVLAGNAEIPACESYIATYLKRIELAKSVDLSNIKSTTLRNQLKDSKNDLLKEVEKATDMRVWIPQEQKRQLALRQQQNRVALKKQSLKPKNTKIISKTTGAQIDIEKKIATIEITPEYKNWASAKTPEERIRTYELLNDRMNGTKGGSKTSIKKPMRLKGPLKQTPKKIVPIKTNKKKTN